MLSSSEILVKGTIISNDQLLSSAKVVIIGDARK